MWDICPLFGGWFVCVFVHPLLKGWTDKQADYLLNIQWITIILDLLINILTYIECSASRAQNFLNLMQYAF